VGFVLGATAVLFDVVCVEDVDGGGWLLVVGCGAGGFLTAVGQSDVIGDVILSG
jgi:hypothetical protein